MVLSIFVSVRTSRERGLKFVSSTARPIKVLCEQTRELTHDFLDYV